VPIRHQTFSFARSDIGGIVDEMIGFAADADGRRWLNVVPDANEDEIHTGSAMWKVFSSRGPVVPKLTWFPSHEYRGKREHAQVGVAHATGRDAVERLTEAGVVTPDGWHLTQDHQKRGIIFVLEDAAPAESVITYGMTALRLLSPFGFEDWFTATFSQQ